jgi:uncharacterized protein YegL
MIGKPLEDISAGLRSMFSTLRKDPYALETTYISIITFDTKARALTPLSELISLKAPELSPHPGTALGAALTLVRESILKDVRRTSASAKGDFKPLVFIFTDGRPTDAWQGPAGLLKKVEPKIANIYAIGCGDEVDFAILSQITDNCIHLQELSSSNLAKLFVWLSASVMSQSQSVNPDLPVSLEKVPLSDGMSLVSHGDLPKVQAKPRLYFHSMCRKASKFYMFRYRYSPEQGTYLADEPIRLQDDFFAEGTAKGPPIDTSILGNIPNCPYCGANALSVCPRCGVPFCVDQESILVSCPACDAKIRMTTTDDGSPLIVDGSQG